MNKKYKIVLITWLVFSLAAEQYKQRKALGLMLDAMEEHQEIFGALKQEREFLAKRNEQVFIDELKALDELWNKKGHKK